MTWIDAAWLAAGVLLGVLHAAGIWRTARQPTETTALLGLGRMLAIGLALAAAAMFGGIIPAAAGWAAGLLISVGVVMASRTPPRQRKATS